MLWVSLDITSEKYLKNLTNKLFIKKIYNG